MSMTDVAARGLTKSRMMPALVVALLGLSVLFVAGHAQTQTLHTAAHDSRHANGFPCH
ncbi:MULTISPECIES: CbtB domain-containing protein [Thalassobaculum]|uniref:Cobalt transporter subunit CbtB n=1 Tax=Thalassobaculum litoreum DSM 18839 TaxID=1123362 RepID=A0A8G2EVX0_9PROT|nr:MULTISPECIES: CbtB domain-containing protein [Thalassobaculum]SDF51459.1 cobalt transporter subunit CbtB [Thalassobaculum litoreum DSM 18839]